MSKDVTKSTSDYVQRAAAKAQRGAPLTGNEQRRLAGFALPALRNGYVPAGRDLSSRFNSLQPGGRDYISVGALPQPADDTSALDARIAALETLTSGLTRQNVPYCSGGVTTTITILRS